jgi:hypothetical protein
LLSRDRKRLPAVEPVTGCLGERIEQIVQYRPNPPELLRVESIKHLKVSGPTNQDHDRIRTGFFKLGKSSPNRLVSQGKNLIHGAGRGGQFSEKCLMISLLI